MFTSTTRRLGLTLPMLSAVLVTLSGQPSPAEPSGTFAPAGSPGQANVMVGQAATVLSTAHYQAQLTLSCGGSSCGGNFPTIAAKRRLNVTRIACGINASAGSTFSVGEIVLANATANQVLVELLTGIFSNSAGQVHSVNQAVDMQVKATQHVFVALGVASGTVSNGLCTATGTLETLQ
jgi:hypothetical protein